MCQIFLEYMATQELATPTILQRLELLWGQPYSMNKVVLQVDITYNDKKIFLLILVPTLSEAVKKKK